MKYKIEITDLQTKEKTVFTTPNLHMQCRMRHTERHSLGGGTVDTIPMGADISLQFFDPACRREPTKTQNKPSYSKRFWDDDGEVL